jgi:serine/threonine-protein kinase
VHPELDLFDELIDLSPTQRRQRLAAVRAQDPALASGVERLLAADAGGTGVLEGLAVEAAALVVDSPRGTDVVAPPFERLGSWRLVELLGTGGMGEVWLGEREDGGFAQQAAVKLVRGGMASDHVVARFVLERQVLARLHHPAISRLLDGGLAADGRPWFAMELVRGLPLLQWIQQQKPTLRQRLELFLRIAEPVEFAHRNLVVHRDLKPGNVLVEATGVPRLLDFGLAKILEADAEEGVTRTELRALTPAYAAPEQVRGEPVSTATDVYSLGVLLYQLLTGELPHRRSAPSLAALAHEVLHESVERPSVRVERRAVANGSSRAEARAEARGLAGDLDVIVRKALEPEPTRRYPSVAALVDDLERHLGGQPINARPATVGYRAHKFLLRHTLAVVAAVVVVASLVSALAISIRQTQRANDAALAAQLEAQRAERVKAFLVSVFEQADPRRAQGADISARQILAEGARRLETELAEEPMVRAELFDAVAHIQSSLGLFDQGLVNAERAAKERAAIHGTGSRQHATSLTTMAAALLGQGNVAEARRRFDQAITYLEPTGDPEALAEALSGRAEARLIEGDPKGSLSDERRAYDLTAAALGKDSAEALEHLSNLAVLETEAGTFAEAVRMFREILAVLEPREGGDTPAVLDVVLNLATALDTAGENREALDLFGRVVAGRRAIYGSGHPALADALVITSLRLSRAGRGEEALAALAEARATYAPLDHPELASVDNYSGLVLADLGRFAEAERAFALAVGRFERDRGATHVMTASARSNLGGAISEQGRHLEAAQVFDQAIATLRALGELDNPRLLRAHLNRGANFRKLGRYAEARATIESTLERALAELDPYHLRVAEAEIELARLDLAEATAAARDDALAAAVARATAGLARADAIAATKPPNPSLLRNLAAAREELRVAADSPSS